MAAKKVKHWLFLITAAAGVCLLGTVSHAAEPKVLDPELKEWMDERGLFYGEYKDYIYTDTNNGKEVKIIGFRKDIKNAVIPAKINGKKVTEIDWISYRTEPKYKNLKSITLSKYITKLEWFPKLREYKVVSANQKFMAKNGILFSKKGKTLVDFPQKKDVKTYRIPKGVKKIRSSAFFGTKARKIIMPDTVVEIGEYAFADSHLREISLSKNLRKAGDHAFQGSDITKLTIPSKLKEIPRDFCWVCPKLRTVTICQGVRKISPYAFNDCKKLRKVVIPTSVKELDAGAFVYISSHVKLEKVNLTIYTKKSSKAYKLAKREHWKGKYGIKVKAI